MTSNPKAGTYLGILGDTKPPRHQSAPRPHSFHTSPNLRPTSPPLPPPPISPSNVATGYEESLVDDQVSQPSKPGNATQSEFFKYNTISEDQSSGSSLPSRRLLALAPNQDADLDAPKLQRDPRVPFLGLSNPFASLPMPLGLRPKPSASIPMRLHSIDHNYAGATSYHPTASYGALHPQMTVNLGTYTGADEGENTCNTIADNTYAEQSAEALNNRDPQAHNLPELVKYIEMLQSKARQLEALQQATVPHRFQTLYCIQRSGGYDLYFDHPEWTHEGSKIKSRKPLHNFDLFLEQNKDISFLIFRTFDDANHGTDQIIEVNSPSDCIRSENPDGPLPQNEWVFPVAKDLQEAITGILKSRIEYSTLLNLYQHSGRIEAPYLFMYHGRQRWESVLESFASKSREKLKGFADYVFQFYGDEYSAAEGLFSQGKIAPPFVKYLFIPGEILIRRKNGHHQGFIPKSWPRFNFRMSVNREGNMGDYNDARHPRVSAIRLDENFDRASSIDDPIVDKQVVKSRRTKLALKLAANQDDIDSCSITAWTWGFDTKFRKLYQRLEIRFPRSKLDKSYCTRSIPVEELDVFPLRFASEQLVEKLKRRGKMLWECRKRCLVSYVEREGEVADNRSDERYMIDQETFQFLNPANYEFKLKSAGASGDELTAEQIERDEPPDKDFQYLSPLTIKGYNLRRKKWYDLATDRISPVVWNKKVFETLVMERKSKDLIQALISKQVASQKSTDLIAGKGNGLILLLHGGPGTGKTLTAESVAEIAEKPLYRVTCGDVGTKAEDVEKYLESVLHLGKIWDCVVLLDEADVFLEQRSLEDLQRNALVSVFLRILEYHEGILILTSNRVGTFDEAFRSRIQLALHYPSLRPFQRQRIWENFFDRLDSFKDDMVDIDDLRDHLEELAKFEMNGRQIRNVITTARQYAEWKEKRLDFEYLKDVIEVSGKFDTYLTKLRGGFSYDQIAEDEGLR